MRRRNFLKLGVPSFLIPVFTDMEKMTESFLTDPEKNTGYDNLDKLGGMSLQDLLDFHMDYLTEIYIPNIRRGIDWEFGGYADETIPGKEPEFEKKSLYYQGRAVWLFSYIYNHITHDKRDLDAAIRGRDFLVKNALTDDFKWNSFLSRKGEKLSKPLDHYGDIYMVLGLTELFKATHNEQDLNIAVETSHSVMDRLVSPFYQHVDAHGPALEPGTKRLASWQHFLNALTALLKVRRDPAVEKIARYCVRVMCQKHWQPEYGVLLEVLDDGFRPYTFDSPNWGLGENQVVTSWHSIQACWMIMDESARVKDYNAFRKGMEMGFSTLGKCYVDGKGLVSLSSPGAEPDPNKYLHPPRALNDALIFCLILLEHIHDPKALSYFNKTFALYNSEPDDLAAQDLLHTPRRFFQAIAILDRMIANNGKVSKLFG